MFPLQVTHSVAAHGTSVTFPVTLTVELLTDDGDIISTDAGKTELTSYVTLTLLNDVPRLDVNVRVENNLSSYRLLAHFPMPFRAETAYYDSHFEIVRRPVNSGVVPQGAFVGVIEPDKSPGLIIANRGLPEVEVTSRDESTVITLTILRSIQSTTAPDGALFGE